MGTTRIKVIDLSSDQKEVKTSRKRARLAESKQAEKLTVPANKEGEEKEALQKATADQAGLQAQAENLPVQAEEIKTKAQTAKAPKKTTQPDKSMHHKSRRYKEAIALIDSKTTYPVKDAITLLHKTSLTKFDPTVELHLNVTDKNIRGKVNFPHAIGGIKKEKRYLIFSEKKSAEIKNVIWADEKTIAEIENGNLKPGKNFDTVITTPKFMPLLAGIAKILGPKGMMPNPKNGTILDDPTKAISQEEDSVYEYRSDPTAPILHTKIGKLSYKDDDLAENLKALVISVGPTKIKRATLSSTMSPGIKVDISTVGK